MAWNKGREVVTRAIVLRSRTVDEDDVLVEFFTPDLGRLWGRARHGRKSRKRFGPLLDSLNILRIRFRDSAGFVGLEEASLDVPLSALRSSIDRVLTAFGMVDLVREMVPERNREPGLFELLEASLRDLDQGKPPVPVMTQFESGFLDLVGYKPEIDRCLGCQKPRSASGRFFFIFREGGVYCSDCVPRHLESEAVTDENLPRLLSRFLEYQIGRPLKSRKFLTVGAG